MNLQFVGGFVLDATIRGTSPDLDSIKHMVKEILSMPIEDGVTFQLTKTSSIMVDAHYPGVRIILHAFFDSTETKLSMDFAVSTWGTPPEPVLYDYHSMTII